MHAPRHQIGHGIGGLAIGHMHHIKAQPRAHIFHNQMRNGANARRRIGEFARIRLDPRHHLIEIPPGDGIMHNQQV